jgi:hypothetical protein
LETLQRLGPFHYSLGKNLALLGQPLLLDDMEDCNYVCKIFVIIPSGVDGYADVGRVRKLVLQNLRSLLGRDEVYHRYVRVRWPLRWLPLFTLSILQHVGRLEVGTHFDVGVTPESGTQQKLLERRLWQNS